jgi:F0F1-type ATP synthase assembly protein I
MSIRRTIGRLLGVLGAIVIIAGLFLPFGSNDITEISTGIAGEDSILNLINAVFQNITSFITTPLLIVSLLSVVFIVLGGLFILIGSAAGKRLVILFGAIFAIFGWFAFVSPGIPSRIDASAISLDSCYILIRNKMGYGPDPLGAGSITFMSFFTFQPVGATFSVDNILNAGYAHIALVIGPVLGLLAGLITCKKKTSDVDEIDVESDSDKKKSKKSDIKDKKDDKKKDKKKKGDEKSAKTAEPVASQESLGGGINVGTPAAYSGITATEPQASPLSVATPKVKDYKGEFKMQNQQVNHEVNTMIYEATIKELGATIGDLNIQLSLANSKIALLSQELEKTNKALEEASTPSE